MKYFYKTKKQLTAKENHSQIIKNHESTLNKPYKTTIKQLENN